MGAKAKKQPQRTRIITRALTNENIHENMQFERNEKHLILITTNYIEPPKYNYVAGSDAGVESRARVGRGLQ